MTQTKLHEDHPAMIAWAKYKSGEDFASSFAWAAKPEHTAGSLWAAFFAGWQSRAPGHGSTQNYPENTATLAPCPFCRGEAVFNDHRPRGSCYYSCGLCGAQPGGSFDSESDAASDWNTRA